MKSCVSIKIPPIALEKKKTTQMAHVHPASGVDVGRVVIKRVYTPPCTLGPLSCGQGRTSYSFILNGVQVSVGQVVW